MTTTNMTSDIRYRASDGETLDQICFAHYGKTQGIVEKVLDANTGLADLGPILIAGTLITLPAIRTIEPSAVKTGLWE